MFEQRVAVHYRDGTEKEAVLTQWSVGQFGQWSMRQGFNIDPANPGLASILMLRFQAFAELHRGVNGATPSFPTWDLTVTEVEPLDEEQEADPTQTGTSVGSSP
jgi:hypothetical protein